MNAPRSRWSVAPAIFGLALAQQIICVAITSGLTPVASSVSRGWAVSAIFVTGAALINTAFYSAAWLGLLGAARIATRTRRIYIGGLAAAIFFFTLAGFLAMQLDPKGPFGSYAQVAVLVATLACGCKLDDARGALAPIEHDPLKRD